MLIKQNSLSPPPLDGGILGGVETRGQPMDVGEFRSAMDQANRTESKANPRVNNKDLKGQGEKEAGEENDPGPSVRKEPQNREALEPRKAPKAKVAGTKGDGNKNSAVQKFMASLESELGISAERFSAALVQIPDELKALPMEETASLVLEKLGFSAPKVNESATTAYLGLMEKSGLKGGEFMLNPTLSSEKRLVGTNSGTLVLGEGFQAANPKTLDSVTQRQRLNASIDELNRRFFNEGKNEESESLTSNNSSQLPALDSATGREPGVSPSEMTDPSSWFNKEVKVDLNKTWPRETVADLSKVNPKLEGSGLNPLELSLNDSLGGFTLNDIEGMSSVAQNPPSPKTWSVEELPFLAGSGVSSTPLMGDGKTQNQGELGSDEWSSEGDEQESLDQRELVNGSENAFAKLTDVGGAKIGNSIHGLNGAESKISVSPSEQSANIKQLSIATESLANKGGGEVKVILSPEGLGTVHLKVKMNEGRLQVQMKADNQESQKILESSLNELKQSLSTHKITLDSVKVDVGGDFTRQENPSNFAQQNFDQGREQARQFMNQFRQENLFQRQPFFEAPGHKTYRSQREESLAPISSEVRPRSVASQGKGREINLVA